MQTFLMYLFFVIGVVLIVKGGDWFVDGAAWVAEVTGIPKFIVGATIISVATTLPEIIVSTIAAIEGHEILMTGAGNFIAESQEKVGMAIGNGIGSVICNTALVMAVSLIFMPIKINRKDFSTKALLLVASVTALFLFSFNGYFTMLGAAVLLVLFAVYIFENIRSAKNNILNSEEEPIKADKKSVFKNIMLIIVGAGCIVVGSRFLVDNGGEIARSLGVSESIIGVTMVAVGTSLPELVTAITAVIKKQPSMSVGNVIGANLIDTTLILSICSFIYGGNLPVSAQSIYLDFPVVILVSLIAIVPAIIRKKFSRWQGIVLLIIYIIYLVIVSTRLDWYLSLFNGIAANV
ncbi:MAG: calcium/sodium antiporter [Acutalibacteraceae bacterium]